MPTSLLQESDEMHTFRQDSYKRHKGYLACIHVARAHTVINAYQWIIVALHLQHSLTQCFLHARCFAVSYDNAGHCA